LIVGERFVVEDERWRSDFDSDLERRIGLILNAGLQILNNDMLFVSGKSTVKPPVSAVRNSD
jgi:hypothetical protein